jgi:hypothetical protein
MKSPTVVFVLLLCALPVVGGQKRRDLPFNADSPAVTLLRDCDVSSQLGDATCRGWLVGAMLGIDASESLKDSRSICFPQGPPGQSFPGGDTLIKLFRDYVQSHPDKLNAHVGHVVYQALLGAYACKKP